MSLYSAHALADYACRLADLLRPGDVIALFGPLGAGKTHLARSILRGLGLDEAIEVPSPTFTLVQYYDPPDVRLPVRHADLYRLETPEAVDRLALEEESAEAVLIVEWPERWGDGLPRDALCLTLHPEGDYRRISVQGPPAWRHRLNHTPL